MSFLGEAVGAAIGTIIFWAAFTGLTLTVCAAANLGRPIRRWHRQRIRRRYRGSQLDRLLDDSNNWPPL